MASSTRKARPSKTLLAAQEGDRKARQEIAKKITGYASMTPGEKAVAMKRALGMDLSAVAAKAVASKGTAGLVEAAAKAQATRKANTKPKATKKATAKGHPANKLTATEKAKATGAAKRTRKTKAQKAEVIANA